MANFVLIENGFRVEVYMLDHPPPHCHLSRNNGSVSVVRIPSLIVRHGIELTRQERNFLIDNLEAIAEAFDNRIPKRD